MLVSIIVPALNEEAGIALTLDALLALEGDKEILVADGGSADRTVAIAAGRGAKIVHAPRGRGPQMHAAVLQSSGEVLWFVHADTRPPTHALREIKRALASPRVAGGNFGLVFDGQSRAAKFMTRIYPLLRVLGLCYGDSGIFVRREVYDRTGGFRPLALFEDLDLLRRIRRAGTFVHLPCRIVTSSRRFERRNFAVMWLQWTALQMLYWLGVSPNRLAQYYRAANSGNYRPNGSPGSFEEY
jgi:rSAM/selenodomain-associated transferase 2